MKNLIIKEPGYSLNPEGEFVIENYNFSKPFADFFPGIAGKYGIPMWVFYVNRAQGICSFGVRDKDHAILEFFPANKAWQAVSSLGFRTFLKIFNGKEVVFYEPFHNGFINARFNLTNRMRITSYGLILEEENVTCGLKVKVEYFTIPHDSYAALARILTIKNLDKATQKIELLDGLPQVIPFGTNNFFLKNMSRTIEAWMIVDNLDKNIPFYRLSVDPSDRPEVINIKEGNFYLGFYYRNGKASIIKPVVDPQEIFGLNTDLTYPSKFFMEKNFRYPYGEIKQGRMPSAFLFLEPTLKPGREQEFYSIIGYMRSLEILNSSVAKILEPGYLMQKKEQNKNLIEELQSDINTLSNSKEFNLYAKQTYLDNIMRGGYPLNFRSDSSEAVFYIYCRKHGDLERDYNRFHLQATYLSQGNGNYRDMNQNRRCDIWFNPFVKDENLITFFNLLQADGFNPLIIKGESFTLKSEADFRTALKKLAKESDVADILSLLRKPFTPGEVILYLEETNIKLKVSPDEFLNILLSQSLKHQEAEHGEGFWTDHWTYTIDLLESYLGMYPEKFKEIIFDKRSFTFYDNAEIVKPRHEKYMLKDGKVRQLHSVATDNAKKEMFTKRNISWHTVRTNYGEGEIYKTTLVNKLLCLLVNKLASLDPFGVGIEMEANKPNWFDSLNGLPALFGSSLCETFQVKRLIILITDALGQAAREKIHLTEEVNNFLVGIKELIKEYLISNSADKNYEYWDKSYTLKEDYRQKTKLGFSGKEIEMSVAELGSFLDNALAKIDSGISKAKVRKSQLYHAYFINEVIAYQPLKLPFVKPTRFLQRKLPLFLEAQVHALRINRSIKVAKNIYTAVKKSPLYDKKLKMYKVTAALDECPEEVGRCRTFMPGWLENESIWLHMEYKYILEILKQGLYQEFYEDFKNVLIPFQEPERYGRSILENSSFLVSSVFADKRLHGNGFVARLSGSTAEFLNIWLLMNLGIKPFFLNAQNELNLTFKPVLAGWLFDRKGNYSFNFLSKINLTYHNLKRKNTFGKDAVTPKRIIFADKDTNPVEILSDTVPSPYAEQIRARQIKRIDIYLGDSDYFFKEK